MLKKSILPLALAIALFSQGCSNENKEQKEEKTISQNQYPLTGLNQQTYTVVKENDSFKLKEANGKVVLYDIYATWCPPCKSAASHLTSLQEKYKDDLIIIGVSIEDDITDEKLLSFREQSNANYILSNSKQNRRLADDIAQNLGLGTRYPIPLMVLYKDGKLINHFVGMVEEEFIESDIKKALNK